MSFQDSLKSSFVRWNDFTGRSSLREWGIWFGSVFAINLVLQIIIGILGDSGLATLFNIVAGLFGLAVIIPNIALSIRRLHDQDRSGWLTLTIIIPIVWLIFMILPGTPGPNRYGEVPAN